MQFSDHSIKKIIISHDNQRCSCLEVLLSPFISRTTTISQINLIFSLNWYFLDKCAGHRKMIQSNILYDSDASILSYGSKCQNSREIFLKLMLLQIIKIRLISWRLTQTKQCSETSAFSWCYLSQSDSNLEAFTWHERPFRRECNGNTHIISKVQEGSISYDGEARKRNSITMEPHHIMLRSRCIR